MTPEHVQNILTRLSGVRQSSERQWEARCPAHDDQHASLGVSIGKDERALVKCLAGCATTQVVRAIGLRLRDLFPAGHPMRERLAGRRGGRIVAMYDYRDAEGTLLYQVVRYEPKTFRQRRADGVWNMDGVPRVLYRLPELVAANLGEWVYVAEGEKDCLSLASIGLQATCNPGGAGKWSRLSDDAVLAGRRVCVIADADPAGRAHAADVAGRLLGRASELRVIELPGVKDAADWISAGGTAEQLARIRDAALPYRAQRQRAHIVQSGEHLRDLAEQCTAALAAANDPPAVFVRCGALVRIATDELGGPYIDPLDKARLRGRLTECADFYSVRNDQEVVADPKSALLETVLTAGTWDLPPLVGVTRAPILRHDGTLCAAPGYDPESRLYYCPSGPVGDVPENPTIHEVDAAIATLADLISDFPFADDASRANALGLLLTLLMRPVIVGRVPLCVVDAPAQGTGKSLLVSCLARIALGECCSESVPTGRDTDDEWRKKITSLLLRGTPFVLLDNVPDGTAIDSPALASVVTGETWSDRRLGTSESVTLPSQAVWACTGNNLRIERDMPRRCYLIRLDADVERPWTRTDFRIDDLAGYITTHRPDLLAAAFTVVRGWYVDACPVAAVPRIGGFEGWASTISGVLAHAGVDGFLANQDQIATVRDDESAQWAAFFEAWYYEFGASQVSTDEAYSRLVAGDNHAAALPDAILTYKDRGPGSARRGLGRSLGRLAGRVYGTRKLVAGEDRHAKVRAWSLIPSESRHPQNAREDETLEYPK